MTKITRKECYACFSEFKSEIRERDKEISDLLEWKAKSIENMNLVCNKLKEKEKEIAELKAKIKRFDDWEVDENFKLHLKRGTGVAKVILRENEGDSK